MKLQPDKQPSLNTVSAYGPDYIEINAQRYTQSLLLSPESPVIEWSCTRFEDIKTEDFEQIAKLDPAVVIFGSGQRIRFPQAALIAPLIARNIGLETMDLQAACRTYNVLMAEGRKVVAALLIEK
ncbi:Mth938-like domain-containing protein [Polynucleobacter sp. MWH-CaK5]|uniref:Mth938-like domain-containing protein n=1 Tax=Polynucleobacter sp. MWH-CaK5 TaxID=2689107 RepID=UPI001BFD56B8|nr:Mth938-like domain-containing protein [Polynucleobacter sp. MWH-CaK5]QWD89551.1 Mth938-like domain-containing protein [Polynucleobacter sp. MWH-CaK5]